MCGCGPTRSPLPCDASTGPKWSRKTPGADHASLCTRQCATDVIPSPSSASRVGMSSISCASVSGMVAPIQNSLVDTTVGLAGEFHHGGAPRPDQRISHRPRAKAFDCVPVGVFDDGRRPVGPLVDLAYDQANHLPVEKAVARKIEPAGEKRRAASATTKFGRGTSRT